MLEVVEHQEEVLVAQGGHDHVRGLSAAGVPQSEPMDEGRGNRLGAGDLGQGDETGPVPEVGRDLPRHLHRQARLADPRRSHEGHAALVPPDEAADFGHVLLPTDQGEGGHGQAHPVRRASRHPDQVVLRRRRHLGQAGEELRRGPAAAPFDLGHVGHVVAERLGQALLGPSVGVAPFTYPRAQPVDGHGPDRTDGSHVFLVGGGSGSPGVGCPGLSLLAQGPTDLHAGMGARRKATDDGPSADPCGEGRPTTTAAVVFGPLPAPDLASGRFHGWWEPATSGWGRSGNGASSPGPAFDCPTRH